MKIFLYNLVRGTPGEEDWVDRKLVLQGRDLRRFRWGVSLRPIPNSSVSTLTPNSIVVLEEDEGGNRHYCYFHLRAFDLAGEELHLSAERIKV